MATGLTAWWHQRSQLHGRYIGEGNLHAAQPRSPLLCAAAAAAWGHSALLLQRLIIDLIVLQPYKHDATQHLQPGDTMQAPLLPSMTGKFAHLVASFCERMGGQGGTGWSNLAAIMKKFQQHVGSGAKADEAALTDIDGVQGERGWWARRGVGVAGTVTACWVRGGGGGAKGMAVCLSTFPTTDGAQSGFLNSLSMCARPHRACTV